MTVTESRVQRFKRAHPCPICGGGDDLPRGQGKRCSGYLSSDGRFAYCTREEHAGQATLEHTDPPSWRHILEGDCRCGRTHNPARSNGNANGDIVATYDYVDETGQLLYQVVRLAGKQFRQRRPDGEGGWIWNLNATRRVLYHLPGVIQAAATGEIVYVVEGEKDVHAIEHAGATATCNPGGALKWKPEYAQALKGATVVIVADRDQPGVDHAQQIAQTIPGATIVQAAQGKDAYDHLAAGLTLADLEPVAAPEHASTNVIVFETLRAFLQRPLPKAEALVGVPRHGTNLLPRYGWVMPWGREGCGKTSVLLDLMFHAACGIPWLNYLISRPIRIVAIVNEGVPGGLQDKFAEKVKAWEGNTDHVLDNISVYASPWGEFTFKNTTMTDHAREYALAFNADYVVLDPLHTLGTTGAGTPEETETFKHILREFGLWKDLGIITAHHSNKNGMVSGDWARHPDTVIRLEKDGKNPATKMTLEKARPADPHELGVPCILEWVTDTMGYRRIDPETRQKVSDEDLLNGIRDELRKATEPLSMKDIRTSVTGDDNRIRTLVIAEIQAGRILDGSTRPDRYLLTVGAPDTHDTHEPEKPQQTRMDTSIPVGDHPTPTSETEASAPDGGPLYVGAPVPRRGTPTSTDHGPDDRPPPDPTLAPEDDTPPADLDTLTPTNEGWDAT